MCGYRKAILNPHEALCKELAAATPDAKLAELGGALRTKKIKVSRTALTMFLAKLKLNFEKILHESEQDRPDVVAARKALIADQVGLSVSRYAFIDETGVSSNLVRRCGRTLAGVRLIGKVPHGCWTITNCIAVLTAQGIVTLATFNGHLNGELFVAFIVASLLPAPAHKPSRRGRYHGRPLINRPRLGTASMIAIVTVELERKRIDLVDTFKRAMKMHAQVTQCYMVTGDADFVLTVVTRAVADFDAFVKAALYSNPNIRKFRSMIALDTVKAENRVLLD